MRCACKVTIKFRQRAQNGPSFQGRRPLFRRKRHGGEETDGRAEHVSGQAGTQFPTGWEQDSRPPVPEFPAAGTRVPGSPPENTTDAPTGNPAHTEDTEGTRRKGQLRCGEEGRTGGEARREGEPFFIPAYTFSGRPGFTGCRAGTPVKKAASIKERTDRDCIHRE